MKATAAAAGLVLFVAACSEYELIPKGDDVGAGDSGMVDTGPEPPEYDDVEDPCVEMTCVEPFTVAWGVTGDWTYCQFGLWAGDIDEYDDGAGYVSYGGWDSIRTIWVFGMDGDDGEGRPVGSSVVFVRYAELEGVDTLLKTWAMAVQDVPYALLERGVTADWWTGMEGMALDDVDGMWEDVRGGSGLHYTDIGWDVLWILVDPAEVDSSEDCEVYLPLEVCVDHDPGDWDVNSAAHVDDEDWANAVAASRALGDCEDEAADADRAGGDTPSTDTGDATDAPWTVGSRAGAGRCVAGSGTFAPVPVPGVRDTLGTFGLAPIHLAGSGALTADARISAWTVIEGPPLERLLTLGANRRRGPRLFSPPSFSGFLPDSTGEIWFRMPSADGGAVPFSTVDMTWDCPSTIPGWSGSTSVDDASHSSRGYSFRLSDIGCPVDWPQRFRLRRAGDWGDGRLWVDLDGRKASLPVGGPVGGRLKDEITIQDGGVVIRGNVMEDEAGVTVRLDEISWHGMPLCQPGVFRLAADGW